MFGIAKATIAVLIKCWYGGN